MTSFRNILFLISTCFMCLFISCESSTLPSDEVGRSSSSLITKSCSDEMTAIQVLGSGGPLPYDARASTGYLVWIGGKSRLMIDAGGGTFVRFGEAGGQLEDLDVVLLSHFHADHVSDLPAFLWGAGIAGRVKRNLTVVGPTGNADYPDIRTFLKTLFDGDKGVFRQLSSIPLDVVSADASGTKVTTVFKDQDLEVQALGVPHANSPTLAFKVNLGGKTIVFGGDQNGRNPAFLQFIQNVDFFVAHLAISEAPGLAAGEDISLLELHAPPTLVGELAATGEVGTLLLSHLMGLGQSNPRSAYFSLSNMQSNLELIKKKFSGTVIQAEDLLCIPMTNRRLEQAQ